MSIAVKNTIKNETLGHSTKEIAQFLETHLEEYGDPLEDILKCMDYALSSEPGKGGAIYVAEKEGEIVGASILNDTGMSGYIPGNILVYIAVDGEHRGEGIGKSLMNDILKHTKGDIALHVEKDNPAQKLYEKVGFEKKYVEMRLAR
ncbi:GNAT family N-acetyltransferase [Algivirga pacifica]|uniref:N-acetyltransferase domain-containing protein n=1 Tax=Algivirga pacifica TaxID=1162670 RepID=A0ABP9D6W3_9BACT